MSSLPKPVVGRTYRKVHVQTGQFLGYVRINGEDKVDSWGDHWFWERGSFNCFKYVGRYHSSEDIYELGTLEAALYGVDP